MLSAVATCFMTVAQELLRKLFFGMVGKLWLREIVSLLLARLTEREFYNFLKLFRFRKRFHKLSQNPWDLP